MKDNTTVVIKKTTHGRLERICQKSQTYDDLINDLLDFKEKHKIPVREHDRDNF